MTRVISTGRHVLAVVVLSASVVTGCGGEPEPEPGASVTVAVTGSSGSSAGSVPVPPASTDTGTTAPAPTTSSVTPAAEPVLVLTVDGLALVSGGASRPLDFGTARAAVTAVLAAQLGAVTSADQPECGQGPRTTAEAGAMTVLFDGDRFVGWFVDGAGTSLTTTSGIGVGSTLAAVQDVYDVSVTEDSLGPEFFTEDGRFGGFLTGTGSGATVTSLHGGETCFFR